MKIKHTGKTYKVVRTPKGLKAVLVRYDPKKDGQEVNGLGSLNNHT